MEIHISLFVVELTKLRPSEMSDTEMQHYTTDDYHCYNYPMLKYMIPWMFLLMPSWLVKLQWLYLATVVKRASYVLYFGVVSVKFH